MSRPAIGSALFVLVGPGVELGAGPWALTGFEVGEGLPGAWPARAAGALALIAGVAMIVAALVRFAGEGEGTPSPLAPPRAPVRGGIYARLRHPMYAGSTLGLVGEAFLLRQPVLLVAAGLFATTMALLVRFREEPLLRRRFGEGWRHGG